VSVYAHTTSGMPGRGAVFVFIIFLDFKLVIFDDSISPVPWPCLGEETMRPAKPPRPTRGDGCPTLLLWRDSAQEAAKHAPALPPVVGVEVSPPELDAAMYQGRGT
jgi:hypothetical protein